MWETCPEFLRRSARLRLEPTTSRSRVRRSTATPRRHPAKGQSALCINYWTDVFIVAFIVLVGCRTCYVWLCTSGICWRHLCVIKSVHVTIQYTKHVYAVTNATMYQYRVWGIWDTPLTSHWRRSQRFSLHGNKTIKDDNAHSLPKHYRNGIITVMKVNKQSQWLLIIHQTNNSQSKASA